MNYCGIGTDFIDYTVDRSPHKQNLFLPGSRIPIYAPEIIFKTKPEYLVILPWNLRDEIAEQMKDIGRWGGKFVTLIPEVKVFAAVASKFRVEKMRPYADGFKSPWHSGQIPIGFAHVVLVTPKR